MTKVNKCSWEYNFQILIKYRQYLLNLERKVNLYYQTDLLVSGASFLTGGVLQCDVAHCRPVATILNRVVCDARFLTGGAFECDTAHCRSVAVLCILYKIICNEMHPFHGAQLVPFMQASAI